VHQTLNTEVAQQVTLYKIAKGSRVFCSRVLAQNAEKVGQNSTPVNSKQTPRFAFFTSLNSKLAMPLNREVVCLDKLHIFPIGGFEVFSKILENVPKF
jgi:hypothetical protein